MHRQSFTLLSCLALLATAFPLTAAAAGTTKYEEVFTSNFNGPDEAAAWSVGTNSRIQIVPEGANDSPALRVTIDSAESSEAEMAVRAMDSEPLRGKRIRCTADVRASNVQPGADFWNGIKVMLHVVTPDGEDWIQKNNLHGDFEWTEVSFIADIPANATAIDLRLGLEKTTGTVWFDNISLSVLPPLRSQAKAEKPEATAFLGHDRPRLRGAMVDVHPKQEDLIVLGQEWGANLIRYQLRWGGFPRGPADTSSISEYEAWLESALTRLEELLPAIQKANLLVCLDLHTPPLGREKNSLNYRLFSEPEAQKCFTETWKKIAARFRDHPAIWSYDLLNEPAVGEPAAGCLGWRELAEVTSRAIRLIDPNRAIVFEPAPWAAAKGLRDLQPLDVPNIIYSIHFYDPLDYTHQGVQGRPMGGAYPGTFQTRLWNEAKIRRELAPALDFQRRHGVHIYVGEFGVIRWAEGAARYLRDCITIFEEYGWDWSYHAFREWHGWSVEHTDDPAEMARSETPTDREAVIREFFALNRNDGT